MHRRPVGPAGLHGQLRFLAFGRDPLGYVESLAKEFPGAARVSMLGLTHIYLWDREAVGDLLIDGQRVFTKDWTTRSLGAVLGQGLFTSEGQLWHRQRALITPALHRKHLDGFVHIAARRTSAYIDRLADGSTRDLKADMTHLTMEIVAEALFGADISDSASRVASALDDGLDAFATLIYTWRRLLPDHWHQPVRRRLTEASAALDSVVLDIIRERRGSPGDSDLLSRFLAARDDEGRGMTDTQLRDEVVTMLLAGHETTAMALTFAIEFLCRHPHAWYRLRDEADERLGDRPTSFEDLSRLPYAAAVFKETLRLRPPIWLFGREATRDCTVGKWQLRAGDQVLVTPWVMHHDASLYERPREFLPERWMDGLQERLPRHAYLPFGGGSRMCAGVHFASMEGTVILSMLSRAATFTLVNSGNLPLNPTITLRPRDPVLVDVARRSP